VYFTTQANVTYTSDASKINNTDDISTKHWWWILFQSGVAQVHVKL